MAKYIASGLAEAGVDADWSKWKLFFCDERHVALTDADSNYKLYSDGLLSSVPIPEENVLTIDASLPGTRY